MNRQAQDLMLVTGEDTLFVRIEAIDNSVSPHMVDDALALAGGVPQIVLALLSLVAIDPGDLCGGIRCQGGHVRASIATWRKNSGHILPWDSVGRLELARCCSRTVHPHLIRETPLGGERGGWDALTENDDTARKR
jgi:hypothetical protein